MPRPPGAGWPLLRRRTSSTAGGSSAHPAPEVGASPAVPPAASPAPFGARRTGSPPLVLLTTVDVGGGRVESVTVTDGDDVGAAATAFCAAHGLPASVAAPLAAHLDANLAAARAARARTASPAVGGGAPAGDAGPRPSLLGARLPPPPAALRSPSRAAAVDPTPPPEPAAEEEDDDDEHAGGDEEVYEPRTPADAAAAAAASPSAGLLTAGQAAAAATAALPPPSPPHLHTLTTPPVRPAAATAHDRLYTQARLAADRADARRAAADAAAEAEAAAGRVRPTWVSAQLAAARGPGPFEDYAHRLYAEGLSAMRARDAAAATAARAAAAAEVEGATWTPALTARTMRVAPAGRGPAWDRLATTPARRPAAAARLETLRADAAAAELAECTFAPRVSAASERLMRARCDAQAAHRVPTHDALFHDAARRRQRLEEAAAARPTASASSSSAVAVTPTAVADRLAARAARAAAKVEAARAAAAAPTVDAATGQPLFRPSVGRAPSAGRNERRLPVGDYLYAKGNASAQRKARAEADAAAAAAAAAAARATPRSVELMARLRARRFRQIHRYLVEGGAPASGRGSGGPSPRGGSGGATSSAPPDLPPLDLAAAVADATLMASMDPEVAADVRRAAALAAARGGSTTLLPVAAFSALMDAAVKGSGPRAYLQPRTRHGRGGGDPACTFAPAILPQSAALARAAGRRPDGVPAVAALAADAASTAARLEAVRAAVEAATMRECTFEPELVARGGGRGKAAAAGGAPADDGAKPAAARASIAITAHAAAAPSSPKLAKYAELAYELDAVLGGGDAPEGGVLKTAAAAAAGALVPSPPRSPRASVAALRQLAARRAAAVRGGS